MSNLIKRTVFFLLSCIAVLTLTLTAVIIFKASPKKTDADNYCLKSYKNTVALYNGEEIIQIYNNIVLNTLPEQDVINFNNGIAVATPAQAEIILEDFDG